MQRDLDLIRLILLREETGDTPEAMSRYTEEQVLLHSELAIEAGFLLGTVRHSESGHLLSTTIKRLTWAGHDFLEAARNETLWRQVRDHLARSAVGSSLAIVQALLLAETKRLLGLGE